MDEIPVGLCQCGCGRETSVVTAAVLSLGLAKGDRRRFIHGHHSRVNHRGGRKLCGACHEWKPLEDFHRCRTRRDGLEPKCKPCNRAYMHFKWIKRKYGMTREQWVALSESQGNECAICRCGPVGATTLDVDHCHESGRVRGLLCRKCNAMLGQATNKPDVLERAAAYLRKATP